MRVEFSQLAVDDLIGIADFVAAQASDGVAARLVDEIEQRCFRLINAPLGGRSCAELEVGLRMITWRRKVTLFYRVTNEVIQVRRIFYRGQNYEDILGRP